MTVAQKLLYGLVVPTTLILIWCAASLTGLAPNHTLPPPWAVLGWIMDSMAQNSFWEHLLVTFARVMVGFFLGVSFGLILGVATGLSEKIRALVDPLIQGFRSIPSLAWVPLFLIWLGIGEESKVALIALGVFFPVYLNMTAGLAGVDRKLIELGRILGLTRWQLVTKIHLPAVSPDFWTGLRGGLGLGWMFVVAAEILGASKGLGFLLEYGRNIARPEIILASILLFAIVGKLTDGLLALAEQKALRWRDTVKGGK